MISSPMSTLETLNVTLKVMITSLMDTRYLLHDIGICTRDDIRQAARGL